MGRHKKSTILKSPFKMRFRPLADGRQSILLDRFADGKHHYEFLQLYLLPETTEKDKRENKRTMRKAETMLMEKTDAFYTQKSDSVKEDDSGILLVDWVQKCYESHQERRCRDLRDIYNLKVSLGKFRPNAKLGDVDRQLCLDYISWLKNDYRTKFGTLLKQKSAFTYATCLRTMLNEAVKAGLISKSPWYDLDKLEKIKEPESKRVYLTIDEVGMLIATEHFNDCVKRAFIFSCFCGLRISDIRKLKWKDISTIGEQWTVSIIMTKTQEPLILPLSKQACKWLPDVGEADDFVFDRLPNTSNLQLNLQSWAKKAGITKWITFHVSRHTFATMLLTLGADIYTVSKLLGHYSVKTTQRYAKIIDTKKDKAVNLVDNVF